MSLIEVLVAMSIFSVVSTAFYMVLFQSARGVDTVKNVANVTQEAQIGFDRMVRDIRQADQITAATDTSVTIQVDFDGNGAISPAGTTNSQGDYEVLTYSYSNSANEIRLNGETLMTGVYCLTRTDGSCYPVFDYSSDHLEYDTNNDGLTTWQELDSSGVASVGNNNGVLDGPELPFITNVGVSMKVKAGNSSTVFTDQAQLRNER
jgi:prepilin-type N-terminal cleavage/methylation domain-containing protein